ADICCAYFIGEFWLITRGRGQYRRHWTVQLGLQWFRGDDSVVPCEVWQGFAHARPRCSRGCRVSLHHSVQPVREHCAMKLFRLFAGAATAASVLAVALPTQAQPTTLRIESIIPAAHASSRAMEIFKAELARRSAGTIEVEVSAGAQRGLKELIDAVHVGSVF